MGSERRANGDRRGRKGRGKCTSQPTFCRHGDTDDPDPPAASLGKSGAVLCQARSPPRSVAQSRWQPKGLVLAFEPWQNGLRCQRRRYSQSSMAGFVQSSSQPNTSYELNRDLNEEPNHPRLRHAQTGISLAQNCVHDRGRIFSGGRCERVWQFSRPITI